MKIKLARELGAEILALEGPVSTAELDVLRAGITKLLRDGRNRVVVELSPDQDISAEAIRELARLDLLARELSGGILISGLTPRILQKVASFMNPQSLRAYATRAEALQVFAPRPKAAPAAIPAAPAAAASALASDDAREKARQDVLARERGDVGALRRRIAELETETEALRGQLLAQLAQRKIPPHETAYQERIRTLEARIDEFLAAPPAAPATPGA